MAGERGKQPRNFRFMKNKPISSDDTPIANLLNLTNEHVSRFMTQEAFIEYDALRTLEAILNTNTYTDDGLFCVCCSQHISAPHFSSCKLKNAFDSLENCRQRVSKLIKKS